MQLTTFIIIATTLYAYVLAGISRLVKAKPHDARDDLLFIFLVPALNEELVIHKTLTTLLGLRGNFLVLILDDASDDRTAEIVRTFQGDPRVLLLERPRNEARTGKGAVLNAGLREIEQRGLADGYGAENIIVTVFDADARVDEDFLEGLTPYFADSTVGGVQSAVRMYNNRSNIFTFWQHLEFLLWGELFCKAKNILRSATLGGNGQCVRLAALARLGNDPWQSASLTEDLDLSLRLLANGWQIRFCPSTAVWQEALPSLRRLVRQRSRWVQGHIVCWRYVPALLKSRLPLYTKIDLLVFMLMPAALPPVGLASIYSWFQFAHGFGHWHLLPLLGLYVLGFSIAPLGVVAWRRTERPNLIRAILHSHLFFCNSFVWLFACGLAVWNILKGRRGWAKTSRVASTGAPPLRQRALNHARAIAIVAVFLSPAIVSSLLFISHVRQISLPTLTQNPTRGNIARARSRLAALPIASLPSLSSSGAAPEHVFESPALVSPPRDVADAAPIAATSLVQEVSQFEESVVSGEFDAVLVYTDGATTAMTVRFDLGNDQHPARLQLSASYRDSDVHASLDMITVGNDSWIRQDMGAWVPQSTPMSVGEQLQPFLISATAIRNPQVNALDGATVLQANDPGENIAWSMQVDGVHGKPQKLHKIARDSGTELTVTYRDWNTAIAVVPPTATEVPPR